MPERRRLTQTQSGKAWEYGLAHTLADLLNVPLRVNNPRKCGQDAYASLLDNERQNVSLAAREAAQFLLAHDGRLLREPQQVHMQSDMLGVEGDVRDIIIATELDEIGLSAKHRHADLKHPRLSETIDWPHLWTGEYATSEYWRDVRPLFHNLRISEAEKWSDLPNKHHDFYVPFLNAFISELERQYEIKGATMARNFMRYMIGRYDFYKVMKENGSVSVQSFNIGNSLHWGKRIALPTEIIRAELKPQSTTTLLLTFNHGWALSMRIHNAETRLTPSVKFAVALVGQPTTLSNHTINYN